MGAQDDALAEPGDFIITPGVAKPPSFGLPTGAVEGEKTLNCTPAAVEFFTILKTRK